MNMAIKQAEYIWLDGAAPVQRLRSKSRIVALPEKEPVLDTFPEWSFDGSSTYQASGSDSDLLLRPVNFLKDPLRGEGNYLVLCEVFNADGTPHTTNTESRLRRMLEAGAAQEDPWIGFEQEYTLLKSEKPLGFPEDGNPAPQGPYYCGVGGDVVFGRPVVEAHTRACIAAGIMIYGINAEVLPGQWEFQIGYRGITGESADPLTVADHLWLARYLLLRIAEGFGVVPTFAAKPVKGDWNGSGMHTNFSTLRMRQAAGLHEIHRAITALGAQHDAHIAVYGDGLAERLTGLHETCAMHEFRAGVADRGASVRIPLHVAAQGCGYLEDRRPAANADPYLVSVRMLETVCSAAAQAASDGLASTCGSATQSGHNGSARRGKKGFWKTGALSPLQQLATGADEP